MGLFKGTLYPFQEDHIARAFVGTYQDGMHVAFNWDTGLGKSIAALQTTALLMEDQIAEAVVLVCERNKLHEWKEDVERFLPSLRVRIHHGPNRKKKLESEGLPDILISTYETYKLDLMEVVNTKRSKSRRPTEMLKSLAQKRLLIVFDEADRLRNRKSAMYKTFELSLAYLRRNQIVSVAMLTATPISKDWENSFNILRLLLPNVMPTVKQFDDQFVRFRDMYGKALYKDMTEFRNLIGRQILTKRKTDPDVMDQFPKKTERPAWIDLTPDQKKLYDTIADLELPGSLNVLRMVCAHPASFINSNGNIAKAVVELVGADKLRAIPSAKLQWLVEYLEPIILDQDEKAVVFTFFGQSVIPLIQEALEAVGIKVWPYHGELTNEEKEHNKRSFKEGGPSVFLSSDSGAKGINLPEASHLIEYDMAPTYGVREQRLNRVSRIGSGGPTVTIRSILARDTIEVPLLHSMLKGNSQSDELLGTGMSGGVFLSAAERRILLLEGS